MADDILGGILSLIGMTVFVAGYILIPNQLGTSLMIIGAIAILVGMSGVLER